MKKSIIIEARTSSSRLPNKIMLIKKFLILITLIIFTGVSMAENTKEKLLIELSHVM